MNKILTDFSSKEDYIDATVPVVVFKFVTHFFVVYFYCELEERLERKCFARLCLVGGNNWESFEGAERGCKSESLFSR